MEIRNTASVYLFVLMYTSLGKEFISDVLNSSVTILYQNSISSLKKSQK
jgi:hypothetical protein